MLFLFLRNNFINWTIFLIIRELLDKIRKFESEQFSSKNKSQISKLEPVNDTGGTFLLREVCLIKLYLSETRYPLGRKCFVNFHQL